MKSYHFFLNPSFIIPNFDGKFLFCLGAQPLYTRSKIFLYLHDLWILLFPMVSKRFFYSTFFMEKSAIYDEDLHASLLWFDSLITMATRIFFPNYDAPAKYKEKLLERKNFFHDSCSESSIGVSQTFFRAYPTLP